jgi:hypothetical protein
MILVLWSAGKQDVCSHREDAGEAANQQRRAGPLSRFAFPDSFRQARRGAGCGGAATGAAAADVANARWPQSDVARLHWSRRDRLAHRSNACTTSGSRRDYLAQCRQRQFGVARLASGTRSSAIPPTFPNPVER